jgi:hypothetical protein
MVPYCVMQSGDVARKLWIWVPTCFLALIAGVGQAQQAPALTPVPVRRPGDRLALEVEKLLRAGTDRAVVMAFIAQWPTPNLTSAEDLAHLQEAGADSALIRAYVRRQAELRLSHSLRQQASAGPATQAPTVLIYPAPASPPLLNVHRVDKTWGTPYLFSDALWWWANVYPFPGSWIGPPYGPRPVW